MSVGDVGNIVSRLQGLKNFNPKRRVKGAPEFMEEMQPADLEIEGTAKPLPNFANFNSPESNIPQEDLGGELTSQSYDVRANVANTPEEDEGFKSNLRKLGSNLWNSFKEGWTPGISPETAEKMGVNPSMNQSQLPYPQTPPIATAQEDIQEGIPPVTSSEQEDAQGLYGKLSQSLNDYFKPFANREQWYGEPSPEMAQTMENAQLRAKGINPDEYRAEQSRINKNTQNEIMERTDKALENPSTTAVYGAGNIVASQPDLQAAIKKITGIDYSDEIARQTSEYEKVLQDIQDQHNLEGNGYNEQEKRIQQRILDNQATEQDKYYIGLAVLLPLLVGAFFGKEAALGALGGSAKGFADILGRKQKDTMENEKLLADIGVNKGNLALKKAELDLKRIGLPAEIKKNLPDNPNEHLIGKNEVSWVDPNTGEQKTGVEIKPGLVAAPEFVKDKEELKEMRAQAQDISTAIVPTKEINELTGDVIDIASKMKDKNFVKQAFTAYLNGENPSLATKMGEPVEYKGRMVNSFVLLEHKIKLLVDAYRQAKGMRALTSTVQDHIDSLFRNPAASFQSYQDTIDQMLYTRDLAQNRLINTVSGAGFVPEFVIRELQPNVQSTFNNLNRVEGEKEASQLLRE